MTLSNQTSRYICKCIRIKIKLHIISLYLKFSAGLKVVPLALLMNVSMDEANLSSRSVYTEYENTVKNMVSLTRFGFLCMGKR